MAASEMVRYKYNELLCYAMSHVIKLLLRTMHSYNTPYY